MPGPDLGFDGGNLRNSCGLLTAFLGDLIERALIAAAHARCHAGRCLLRPLPLFGTPGMVNCI
jgi:hypothetical protein